MHFYCQHPFPIPLQSSAAPKIPEVRQASNPEWPLPCPIAIESKRPGFLHWKALQEPMDADQQCRAAFPGQEWIDEKPERAYSPSRRFDRPVAVRKLRPAWRQTFVASVEPRCDFPSQPMASSEKSSCPVRHGTDVI